MRALIALLAAVTCGAPLSAQCVQHVLTENGVPTALKDVDAHLGWIIGGQISQALLWNPSMELVRTFPRPAAGYTSFGDAVALDEQYVAIGDRRSSVAGPPEAGAVWVFDRATGALVHTIQAQDAFNYDWFGNAVDIADGRLYVGAQHENNEGSVYVFDLASGQQLMKWKGGPLQDWGDNFGTVVDVVGGLALVGAPFNDANGADTGTVFVLDAANGHVVRTILGPAHTRHFGTALDLRGTTAVVGTRAVGATPYRAFIVDAAAGTVEQELAPPTDVNGFGWDVAIGPNRIAAGSPFETTAGQNAGAVHFFDTATGAYIESVFGGEDFDFLGQHLAGDGHRVVAGKRGWVFATGGPDCNGNSGVDACDVALGTSADVNSNWVPDECEDIGAGYCDSTANSSGGPARLTTLGSNASADNDVRLYLTHAPQNQFGYFLMSSVADDVPGFGGSQGTLCLGAPIVRLVLASDAVFYTGTSGTAVRSLDLGNLPQNTLILPGETWHFQAWFRDVVGVLLTSNTSDGRAVTFR